MTLWLILAAITLAVVALLLLPLLRRPAALAPRRDYDLSVYRQQLAEIERDLERGVLSEGEAGAARTEVERRMLQAADQAEGRADVGSERSRLLAAVAIAALLPIAAFLAYQRLGMPQLADRRLAEETVVPDRPAGTDGADAAGSVAGLSGQQLADVETMIARLAERARSTPDDLEVWLRLGRAYGLTGRPAQSVEAFREALQLSNKRPDIAAEYGESLVMQHDGEVVQAAREVFADALAAEPREPRARYYLGLAAAQDGDWQVALERWTGLAEDSAPNAPWLPALRERIADAALALGRDPSSLPIMAKLDQAAAQAAAQGAAGEGEVGEAEIESMVAGLAARLEADPKDLEGWLMLARSYQVLGRLDEAQAAIERADTIFAKAPFLRQQIAETARELGLAPPGRGQASDAAPATTPPAAPPGPGAGPSDSDVAAAMAMPEQDRNAMIRGMVEGLAARLEAEPEDLQGWVMLLRSYRVLGEEQRLAESLDRARTAFAERPADRAEIERLAEELGLPPQAQD